MDRDAFEKMQSMNPEPQPEPQEQHRGMQFGFDVVEVQKVNLQPGDVLMVTVKNDEVSQDSIDGLRNQLQYVFPENKVFVFAMGTSDDVQLSVVSRPQMSYCDDCSCGKKEQSEAIEEVIKNEPR